ncbi:hypothetical protein OG393_02085 [Streptomyces sp. NBC_01216]|uniref:DUF6197 family protein n=1 Tax=Streptomyces sp. NBC_01216 TaxID=2903778 RepID=UPI002E1112B8|nr:hypothetical protein OG393_02085 [Streptomyces sp. NBC_01216]
MPTTAVEAAPRRGPAPSAVTAPSDTAAPETVDRAGARLHDSAAWQEIVRLWDLPVAPHASPAPSASGSPGADRTEAAPFTAEGEWRGLLSVPVDQLVATALKALPAPPPAERRLPGRVGAVLPDRLHVWRRVGQPEVTPSVHLAHARRVLVEWGWQNRPYRLRDIRGARCVCGALLTAHRLGYGSVDTMNRAAAWIVTELRAQGWNGLIGPWNRAPGRTAEEALALIDATIRRAAHAGQ